MIMSLVCVDAGTTNTRVWLVDGGRVLARREASVGARDTARDGHTARLRGALRVMVAGVQADAPDAPRPAFVAAAGMITSPQGLFEVAHIRAPAGIDDLARAAVVRSFDDVTPLPFVFVPGVRTTERPAGGNGIGSADVMRGEETLCVGLLRREQVGKGGALLNLGSHWKLIRLDEHGRVAWSVSSLSGEMMQAVRTQTILASGLPDGAPAALDERAFQDGMEEARRSGLPRALFCVRLLELSGDSGPEERLSFLIGAFVATDLAHLRGSGGLPPGTPVAVSGGEKLGGAWTRALEDEGYSVRTLSAADVEDGLLAGLQSVMEARARLSGRRAVDDRTT